MSGGHFNYDQHKIGQIADSIQEVINNNNSEHYCYNNDTIDAFEYAIHILRMSEIIANRIDWLLSGDDGEKTFNDRLIDELTKYSDDNNL